MNVTLQNKTLYHEVGGKLYRRVVTPDGLAVDHDCPEGLPEGATLEGAPEVEAAPVAEPGTAVGAPSNEDKKKRQPVVGAKPKAKGRK